ncbi:unnamed protein product [marine sediment metagenome]|uniref:Uncharacterized protein n=1 Tax=marine sediment metagenome TaxID=412755 RepID=X1U6M0_9ZZZZ
MKLLDLKLRMMVMWIWAVVGITASLVFVFLEPARVEHMMSEIEAWGVSWFIIGALLGIIPLLMAFLTITLKDRANRLTNRILSIIYTALMLAEFVGMSLEPAVHQILIMGSVVVASAYIIFYSWKWPVKEA